MSIQSEITRISANVTAALAAIARKGVTVPSGSNSDDLEDLIDAISAGGGSAISIVDELDSHGGTIRHINGVSLAGDTVAPDKMLAGTTAHNAQGQPIEGEYTSPSAVEAGTPVATKGAVSNHSVLVTPSVTNTAGVIAGGTKTGTPVTVSASELVSGSETKTANGTYDVTNLASLVVNVAASGKNGQLQSRVARTSQTTYTDLGFEITVAKTGTYNIYWAGYRSSTSSGTNGAQVYVNGASSGNAFTTFDSTYTNCQNGHLDNVSLAAGDKVTLRGRARNTSSYFYVFNLAIIEQ